MIINKLILVLIFILSFNAQAFASQWYQMNDLAEKTDLEQAYQNMLVNPESFEGNYILGIVYLKLYENSKALEIFEKLLKSNPDSIEANWGKAEALRRFHEIDESEKILDKIVKSNLDFAPAFISLAYIKYTKQKYKDGVVLLNAVIALDSNKIDLVNRVRALSMLAGLKGMLAYYGGPVSKIVYGKSIIPILKKAHKLQPKSAVVLYGFGSFYLLAPGFTGGKLKLAKIFLEKTILTDPKFAEAYVRLAQVYKREKNIKLYEEFLNKALELDSGNELALDIKSKKCNFICFN